MTPSRAIAEAIATLAAECQAALDHCVATAPALAVEDQAVMLGKLVLIRDRIRGLTHRKAKRVPPIPAGTPGAIHPLPSLTMNGEDE